MSSSQTRGPLPHPTPRWRDRLVLVGLLGLVAVGLAGLAAATGWHDTMAQIARVTPVQIMLLLSLSLINYGLRGLRWHLFARCLGLRTTFMQNLRHFIAGFAMSVTPGRIGELVRMRWLRRETGWAFERTAPLMLVDRASDLGAMALLLGLAIAMSAAGLNGGAPVAVLAFLAAMAATRPKLLMIAVTRAYRAVGHWPRLFARARTAARSLRRFSGIRAVLPTLVLGLAGWFAEGYAFYLLLSWMGAEIDLWLAVAIFVFATLAGGLTGAPGGLGGAEAAMVALLSLQGIPLEIGVAATAIIRITTLWFAIAIGLVFFPIAERHSLKVSHALEN